ncbi:cytochrome c oxidase subunit II [Natronorubrum aibiense]|uniref:Cytochrome c oxidase subunit II n=1 Tax=Natronorubrum aibiense TaxID=348826 RepID=A0A5P9P730_9EURY|nr:cytochrome c oxidase subunit II [Natronorubrum aibiense]QFU83969.1 cytochrome c oxidase subunit II [Natronorubrum aibiense]
MQADTRADVFGDIFVVFLGLGTLVGIVVVAYTLYNAYKYRDTDQPKDDSLPTLGELPTGGKGGKKLFLSFGISAIIVISLVIWTYGMLLYVEDPQDEFEQDPIEVDITGEGFAWHFEYENGVEATNTLNVPADRPVAIEVTSGDVWHTFGIADLRVKADAIPGEYDETWFMAEEAGAQHEIKCYELCGDFHSNMVGTVQVMEQDEFDTWLDDQLTLEVTLEDENEEPVTDGYELQLVHQNNDEYEADLEYTYTADDFENGTITIDEIEQGGTYDLTITSDDDSFDTIEESVDITSPSSETYTIETSGTEDTNDETDETDETNSETNDDGGEN